LLGHQTERDESLREQLAYAACCVARNRINHRSLANCGTDTEATIPCRRKPRARGHPAR
jgi:hypothetical protein